MNFPSNPHLSPSKVLFVRMDRIGDLVLTLPVDQALLGLNSNTSVDWWIPKGLSFVTESAKPKRSAVEVATTLSFIDFFKVVSDLRKKRYRMAVVFQGPWWVSAALAFAGVPVRIGVRSKPWSFLFFNRGVRQKRSRSDRSELEYNFQLLEDGLRLKTGSLPRSSLVLHAPFPLIPGVMPNAYFVVHPGMGGSALNWPTARYVELVRTLARRSPVIITGTQADEAYLSPLKVNLEGESQVIWLDGKLKGQELIGLLAHASAIIAPSTGVLHLAASTGQPTVGIFSQIRVQRALRWGPMGPRTAVVEAPSEAADSMGEIRVEDIIEKLAQI